MERDDQILTSALQLSTVRDDFIRRLERGGEEEEANKTELQAFIDEVVAGLKYHDTIEGDGGQEVIDRLADFCKHSPPSAEFQTLDEYLEYRNVDAAVP